MPERIDVAVAGAGYFAQFHYDAWSRIPGVSLVACCDRVAEKARETASRHGIPATFASVDEMLNEVRPDILDIAMPPDTHLASIKAAAASKVDVVCQKPFCRTRAEAEQAISIADGAGIAVVVHENFRFQPWHRKAKDFVDSGRLGTIYQATFRMRPGDGQGPEAYLSRQPYFQKMPRFLIHATGIHFIDTFRFLFGEISAVTAHLRRLNPVITGEDAGIIIFEFANGVCGLLDGNRLADHIAENHRLTMGDMWIEGSAGTLRLDGEGRLFLREKGSMTENEILHRWEKQGFAGDSVFLTQQAIVDARLGKRPYENLARDYIRNIEIEEAVYRSNETGCRVTV